jgi:hypothetical protein
MVYILYGIIGFFLLLIVSKVSYNKGYSNGITYAFKMFFNKYGHILDSTNVNLKKSLYDMFNKHFYVDDDDDDWSDD